eukprot:TRINITY_DN10940_c0_g1_i1.p1 TRINITY_DN10940_c0_g1~~TRINITY_DN10940_c0_g1_i1.p1  ORF type:complete len:417 (+),score=58.95 TRINITY_DN10940_c0_g1_i1:178-1428(+)
MSCWIAYDADTEFPIQNLPFGVFELKSGERRCATAIGNFVVDLKELANVNTFSPEVNAAFQEDKLNTFMGLGRTHWKGTRDTLQKIFSHDDKSLQGNEALKAKVLLDQTAVKMVLPCRIGDYTDFYSSREHATNLGKLFRPGQDALLPNWLHLPVGYHGRSSTIVVSGTPVKRPAGQQRNDAANPPVFGPSTRLDMELEVGAFVGKGTKFGERITMENAKEHIFGLCLFNDWSARDIQKWEYVPLGPFLGKSFASTISPWIVTLDALEPFVCRGPPQGESGDPTPLPYLIQEFPGSYDIKLQASIKTPKCDKPVVLTNTNFKNMYWSVFQQIVHHTVNGCPMNPGDLFASGTISGSEAGSYGSMLEISWAGQRPVDVGGEKRSMFQDGDSVSLSGYCEGGDYKIGFGPCEGTILPN